MRGAGFSGSWGASRQERRLGRAAQPTELQNAWWPASARSFGSVAHPPAGAEVNPRGRGTRPAGEHRKRCPLPVNPVAEPGENR